MRTFQPFFARSFLLFVLAGSASELLACGDDPADAGSDRSASLDGATAASGGTDSGTTSTTDAGASSEGGTTPTGGSASDSGSASDTGAKSDGATADSSMVGGGVDGGADGGNDAGSGTFALSSPNHMDGAKFAAKYTCAEKGFNASILPELNWTPGPSGTKSYALTFIDRTLADKGMVNGYHWAIWNIPASIMKLPEGMTNASAVMGKQTGAFLGPCPNFVASGNTDNYEFTLYALKSETVNLAGSGQTTAQTQSAEKAFEMDNLAKVKLKGSSDAKPPM